MPANEGDRVTALLSANENEIKLLGHGVYLGRKGDLGFPNPCIRLDSGKTVWGMECWWGAEDKMLPKMRERFPNAAVIEVDIDDARQDESQ